MFRVVPKLIAVETGQVIYSEPAEGTASESDCGSTGSQQNQMVLQDARESMLIKIRQDVAPDNPYENNILSDTLIATLRQQGYKVVDVVPTGRADTAEIETAFKRGKLLRLRTLLYK